MGNEGDEKHQQQHGGGSVTTEMPLGQESAIPAPRRKRNNSLIPPELMNDNSEGGRERAALATVFGVREYTESKIFWERQVAAYHEGPISTSTGSHSATGSDDNNNNNHLAPAAEDGFVSITSKSIVSSPIGGTSTREKRKSGASITHLVDSVFDSNASSTTATVPLTTTTPPPPPVATDNQLQHSTITSSSAASPNFSLPDIPVVSSEFNDLMVMSSKSISTRAARIERPSTAPPLSVLTTFQPRASSVASSSLSGLTLDHEVVSIAGSEQHQHMSDMTPPLVFTEPPAIFDLLLSDDDERIVVWGPDPQAVSASMATTTIAGKTIPSSPSPPQPPGAASTASFASTQTAPPNIKGFSSNTTTTATVSNPTPPAAADTSKQRRRGRWSGQLLPDGFKLVSKSSLPLRRNRPHSQLASSTNDDVRESILFKFAKRHGRKDKHRDLHDSNNNTGHTQLAKLPKVIEAATIEKLVEKLTNTLGKLFGVVGGGIKVVGLTHHIT